jgi:hypothetical protein
MGATHIVTFVASSRAALAPRETIYVTGNHELLGNWSGAGLALECGPDGCWRATIRVPTGTLLEFKLTKGSWKSVENGQRAAFPVRRQSLARHLLPGQRRQPFLEQILRIHVQLVIVRCQFGQACPYRGRDLMRVPTVGCHIEVWDHGP